MKVIKNVTIDKQQLLEFAKNLTKNLRGGELIVLIGDLGAGKTTFVQACLENLTDEIIAQSPTFTLENIYPTKDLTIHHFDFYRLEEPGMVGYQLQEALSSDKAVVFIEWPGIVEGYLVDQPRLIIEFKFQPEPTDRQIICKSSNQLKYLLE